MAFDGFSRWTLIEITTHSDAVEALSEALTTMGALGVTSRQEGDDVGTTRVLLEAYFPFEESPAELRRSVRRCLRRVRCVGLPVEPGRISSRVVAEEDWTTSWRSFFAPQRFGGRLLVLPSWESLPEDAPSAVVWLDPGMAFGTGAHASTQLVLRYLVALPVEGSRVADVGTGSGILAIAAAKLGAAFVVAVDNDPQAVRVAAENIHRNGVAHQIALSAGTLCTLVGTFDVVLMNISASVIGPALPNIRQRLAVNGRAVLSGITNAETPDIQAALDENGYETLSQTSLEGWTAFLVRGKENILCSETPPNLQ